MIDWSVEDEKTTNAFLNERIAALERIKILHPIGKGMRGTLKTAL